MGLILLWVCVVYQAILKFDSLLNFFTEIFRVLKQWHVFSQIILHKFIPNFIIFFNYLRLFYISFCLVKLLKLFKCFINVTCYSGFELVQISLLLTFYFHLLLQNWLLNYWINFDFQYIYLFLIVFHPIIEERFYS